MTVYFTFGQPEGTVYFGFSQSNTVIPYEIMPTLTDGNEISAWVSAHHGRDPNGDGAFDVGRVLHNTEVANDIKPAGNDTVDYDSIEIFQQPIHGSATLTVDTISYTPSANYVGLDVIGYSLIKDGAPVAMGSVYLGVYGASVPTNLVPSYRDIPAITAVMDQNTEVSLSQYVTLGTGAFKHRLRSALDVVASVDDSVLTLTPNSALHGIGLGKVSIELVSIDGSIVYDTQIITINKVRDTSFVSALITVQVNGIVVFEDQVDAYAPETILKEIKASYGGIVHNNQPVKVEVFVKRLDDNQTENVVAISGNIVVKEIV